MWKCVLITKIWKNKIIEWSFTAKSNIFYSFLSCFCLTSPPSLQGSSSCTVHEQRSFERKAEEDDGKVSSWMADWFTLEPPLSVFFLLPLNQCLGLREGDLQGWAQWPQWGVCQGGCVAPEQTTPWGWACECVTMETGRVTDTSRSQLLSCLLSLYPPPLSSHHTETPGTHMLPLCSRTCQQRCVYCEAKG